MKQIWIWCLQFLLYDHKQKLLIFIIIITCVSQFSCSFLFSWLGFTHMLLERLWILTFRLKIVLKEVLFSFVFYFLHFYVIWFSFSEIQLKAINIKLVVLINCRKINLHAKTLKSLKPKWSGPKSEKNRSGRARVKILYFVLDRVEILISLSGRARTWEIRPVQTSMSIRCQKRHKMNRKRMHFRCRKLVEIICHFHCVKLN